MFQNGEWINYFEKSYSLGPIAAPFPWQRGRLSLWMKVNDLPPRNLL